MKLARLSLIAGILAWATLASAQEQVRCKDGTMSEGGRGACSHHGGVAKEAAPAKPTPAAKPPAPAKPAASAKPSAAPAGTPVRCADGTMSEAGRGACSHHGGVAKDVAKPAPPAAPAPKAPLPPAPPAATTAATVRCADGTMSEGGRGACSHHGGIAKDVAAAPAPPVRPAPAPPPPSASPTAPTAPPPAGQGQPTARCKDGTLSYSQHHSGTCSNHGGVAAWLDGTKQ